MDPSAGTRAALIPRLGPRAWAIVGGGAISATSYGFVAAFLMLYLHYARGMSLGTAGVVLAVAAVGGLIVSPLVGSAVDHYGARLMLVIGSLVAGAGTAALALVHSPWQAMGATLVFGLGSAGIIAPEATLLATSVPKERRSAAYALQYTGWAVGWSLGALLGGWFVDLHRVQTFVVAFVVAALPFAVYAGIIGSLSKRSPYEDDTDEVTPAGRGATEQAGRVEASGVGAASGYRLVLRDRAFLQILAFFFLIITFAAVQVEAAFPVYAVGVGGVSTRVVGLAFAADTVVIVASQLFVLRALAGRRRSRALVASSLICGLSWLVVLAAGHAGGSTAAAAGFVVALMVFALAETMWSPCLTPMVNDNALLGTVDSGGRIVGPIFAGFLLGAGLGNALVLLLAAVSVCGALLALRLERRVPDSANRVGPLSGPAAGPASGLAAGPTGPGPLV